MIVGLRLGTGCAINNKRLQPKSQAFIIFQFWQAMLEVCFYDILMGKRKRLRTHTHDIKSLNQKCFKNLTITSHSTYFFKIDVSRLFLI